MTYVEGAHVLFTVIIEIIKAQLQRQLDRYKNRYLSENSA